MGIKLGKLNSQLKTKKSRLKRDFFVFNLLPDNCNHIRLVYN